MLMRKGFLANNYYVTREILPGKLFHLTIHKPKKLKNNNKICLAKGKINDKKSLIAYFKEAMKESIKDKKGYYICCTHSSFLRILEESGFEVVKPIELKFGLQNINKLNKYWKCKDCENCEYKDQCYVSHPDKLDNRKEYIVILKIN